MAKRIDPRLIEILTKYDERAEDALWDCHGTWVAYHSAVERIGAKAGIVYGPAQVLVAERDAAAILVTGTMGGKTEWSIGEAVVNLNYRVSGKQAAYPFAMAEKRAKDRVILKLIGLHGLVYSEEESDDFKEQNNAQNIAQNGEKPKRQVGWRDDGTRTPHSLKKEKVWDEFQAELLECTTVPMITKLALAWSKKVEEDKWPESWKALLREEMEKRRNAIKNQPAPDADSFPTGNTYADNFMAG